MNLCRKAGNGISMTNGELLCLFLGSRVPELQAFSVNLILLVARSLSWCPWAKLLDLHSVRGSAHPIGSALKGSGQPVAHITSQQTFKSSYLGMAEHHLQSQSLAVMASRWLTEGDWEDHMPWPQVGVPNPPDSVPVCAHECLKTLDSWQLSRIMWDR